MVEISSLTLKISRSESLPVLPNVLVQILQLYENVNVSSVALEKIIAQDPALTARIMRVASSAAYGSRPVGNLTRAVSVIGMRTLRSISISLGYQYLLVGATQDSGLNRLAFWKHCLATGIGAKAIARYLNPSVADEIYLVGLMHDIGVLTLDRFMSPELNQVIKTAQLANLSLSEADMQVMGFDHSTIGGFLTDKWKLSPMTVAAVKYHHNPDADDRHHQTTLIIAGANHLAYGLGYPAVPGVPGDPRGDEFFERLNLTPTQLDDITSKVAHEVDETSKTYSD